MTKAANRSVLAEENSQCESAIYLRALIKKIDGEVAALLAHLGVAWDANQYVRALDGYLQDARGEIGVLNDSVTRQLRNLQAAQEPDRETDPAAYADYVASLVK